MTKALSSVLPPKYLPPFNFSPRTFPHAANTLLSSNIRTLDKFLNYINGKMEELSGHMAGEGFLLDTTKMTFMSRILPSPAEVYKCAGTIRKGNVHALQFKGDSGGHTGTLWPTWQTHTAGDGRPSTESGTKSNWMTPQPRSTPSAIFTPHSTIGLSKSGNVYPNSNG